MPYVGIAKIKFNFIDTTNDADPNTVSYEPHMFDMGRPTLWLTEGSVWAIPLRVIKNARQIYEDRRALGCHSDVVKLEPVLILLGQAMTLPFSLPTLVELTEHDDLNKSQQDTKCDSP